MFVKHYLSLFSQQVAKCCVCFSLFEEWMLVEFEVMVDSVYVFQEDKGDYSYVERIRIPLTHGTLLLMEGCTQEDWQVRHIYLL